MIRIVNKRTHTPTRYDVYIGRGSPLGNPYSWKEGTKAEFIVGSREEAIAAYEPWFHRQRLNDTIVHAYLNKMKDSLLRGEPVNLVCFCAPDSCHGDIIKKYLEDYLEAYKKYHS
jgi:hypothetical protein